MTHRDELLALQSRIEAQERDLDEAKSENELLRAAHAGKTRQVETLRRELEAQQPPDDPPEAEEFQGSGPEVEPDLAADALMRMRRREVAQSMRVGLVGLTFLAMLGSMMLLSPSRYAHQRRVNLVHGMPMAGTSAVASAVTPLIREGSVVSTSGPQVVDLGTECTIERMPAFAGAFDCRIEVRCGDQTLYGSDPRAGYVQCGGHEVVSDRNMAAIDGDPAMTLDLARGVVTLQERVGLATQRVRIELR